MMDNRQIGAKDKLRSILQSGSLEVSRAGERPRNGWNASWLLKKSLAAIGVGVNFVLTAPAAAVDLPVPAVTSNAPQWAEIAGMPVHVFKSSKEYEKFRANLNTRPELYKVLGAISDEVNEAIASGQGAFSILDSAAKPFLEKDTDQVCMVYMNLGRAIKEELRAAVFGKLPAAIVEADSSVPGWKAVLAFDKAIAGESLEKLKLSAQATKAVNGLVRFVHVFTLAHEATHCRMTKDIPARQLPVDQYYEAGPDLMGALYAAKAALASGESVENVANWIRWVGEVREDRNHARADGLSAAYFSSGAILKGFSRTLSESGIDAAERMISVSDIKSSVDAFTKKRTQMPQVSVEVPAFGTLTASLTQRLQAIVAGSAARDKGRVPISQQPSRMPII